MKKKITVENDNVYVNGNLIRNSDDYNAKEDYYANVIEYFNTGKTASTSHLAGIMSKVFSTAEKNIDKSSTMALQTMKLYNEIMKETSDYVESKREFDTDMARYLLQEKLFPWQKNVYNENNKKLTMLCGRRSGKSYCVCDLALKHCLEKDVKQREAYIIGLTIEKTANIYWQNLKDRIKEAHISTKKIDNSSYTITLSNGNKIILYGNNSKADREKLRGKDFSFVAIDEMQSQQGLYYLMTDIIGPIIKGRDGTIVLLGTAPLTAGTYWEQAINDDKYSHFHATMEDNPTIPNYEHALEDVLEQNHWSRDNITFRREYLGEVAYDNEVLIYPYRNYYTDEIEEFKPTKAYIGVDWGWNDYSSFAPIIVDDNGNGFLVDEWRQNAVASSALVEQARIINEKIHKEFGIPYEDIKFVADSSHQQISADIYNQGINIINAYKPGERAQIAYVREALETKSLLVKKGDFFDTECNMFSWQFDNEKNCVIYKIDESTFHGDIVDSVKYAWTNYLFDLHCWEEPSEEK